MAVLLRMRSSRRQPGLELGCSLGPWSLIQPNFLCLSLVYRGILGYANSYLGLHWLSQDGEGLLLKRMICSGRSLVKVHLVELLAPYSRSLERDGFTARVLSCFFPQLRGSLESQEGPFPTMGLVGLCRVQGEWGPRSPQPLPSLCP